MDNLTDQEKLFLEVLFTKEAGGKPRKAMTLAGYSTKTPVSSVVNKLVEEIADATRRFIATSAPQAVFEMAAVLDEPIALGNKDKMAAAKDVLDRAGFVKTEKVEVSSKEPIFILPAKD